MVDLQTTQDRIEPIRDRLVDAHERAIGSWTRLLSDHADLALPLDASARASFIHCHLEREVDVAVGDEPGIEPTDKLGFFALLIDSDILLRFKFLGHGAPSNVPTGQQRYLARQQFTEDMTLALMGDESLLPPTFLTCGYTLEDGQLGRIEIRRDCMGHPPWAFDIHGGDAIAETIPIDGMADTAKPATVTSITKKDIQEADEASESDPS